MPPWEAHLSLLLYLLALYVSPMLITLFLALLVLFFINAGCVRYLDPPVSLAPDGTQRLFRTFLWLSPIAQGGGWKRPFSAGPTPRLQLPPIDARSVRAEVPPQSALVRIEAAPALPAPPLPSLGAGPEEADKTEPKAHAAGSSVEIVPG